MKTIEEIRHTRLLQLLGPAEYGSLQALAKQLERSAAQISQWKNKSKRSSGGVCNIDSESARHIEKMTGKPRGWMDNDPSRDETAISSMGKTVADWLDHNLPEDKRMKAFWVIHQMVFADDWPPTTSTPAQRSSTAPSPEPTAEPAPSGQG